MHSEDQKIKQGSYFVVPRTLIFIFNPENKVLLIKGEKERSTWKGLWNAIGGHAERAEDILTAAKRELFEETGIYDIHLNLCGMVTIDTGKTPGIQLFVFKGKCNCESVTPSEEGAIAWYSCDTIESIPAVADLQLLLQKVLTYKVGDEPFFALYTFDEDGELKIHFA